MAMRVRGLVRMVRVGVELAGVVREARAASPWLDDTVSGERGAARVGEGCG